MLIEKFAIQLSTKTRWAMGKSRVVFAAITTVFFTLAYAESANIITTTSIGKVQLGMTQDDVIGVLGNPSSICLDSDVCEWGAPAFHYDSPESDRLIVGFFENSVDTIVTKSKVFVTKSGVRVGDTFGKLEKVYGKKLTKAKCKCESDSSVSYHYYVRDSQGHSVFFIFPPSTFGGSKKQPKKTNRIHEIVVDKESWATYLYLCEKHISIECY